MIPAKRRPAILLIQLGLNERNPLFRRECRRGGSCFVPVSYTHLTLPTMRS